MSSPGFQQLDTSFNIGDAVSPTDAFSALLVGIFWAGSLYAVGMIWTTLALIDRWRGPHGLNDINLVSVIGAFILSIPWPAVLILMGLTG